MNVECVIRAEATVGESPVWSPKERLLYWVDISGKVIYAFNPHTSEMQAHYLPEIVTSLGLRKQGGLILTLRKQFAFYDLSTRVLTPILEVEKNLPDNRFNDGKCDRFGRYWAGTINGVNWMEPSGTLYCLHPNGTVMPMLKEGICFNGLGWSPDDKTMYVTESFRYTTFAYDFDLSKGTLSRRREFAVVSKDSGGFPDGLTVDSDGYVWSAQTGNGQVIRYHPNGKIDQIIKFPVPRTTSCIFGGEDRNILYVTTARETMNQDLIEKYPLSGSVFSIKTTAKGLHEPSFNG